MTGFVDGHDPATHTDRCFCGRPARWHVDGGVQGCANLCGIHARVVQRRSLWSAVFSDPIIIRKETENMDLTIAKRAALEAHADRVAETLSLEFGGARVGRPEYTSADLRHGGWSILVVGVMGDFDRRQVRVYADGTTADVVVAA